jgi:hypothetical protein
MTKFYKTLVEASSRLNPLRRKGQGFLSLFGMLLLGSILITEVAKGQAFNGTYPFTSVTTTSGTTDPTAVPTATGVTFGSFTAVGTPANPSTGGRFSFITNPLGATNGSDVFVGTFPTAQYYQVSVTVTGGATVNLTGITFTIQRSGTGIRQFSVRSDADAYVANLPASEAVAALSVVPTNIFQITDATTTATTGSINWKNLHRGAPESQYFRGQSIKLRFYYYL